MVAEAPPLAVSDAAATLAPDDGDPGEKSLTDVNKELTNPVSSLWSITFQQNNFLSTTGPGGPLLYNPNLLFQPVLPVALTGANEVLLRLVELLGCPVLTSMAGRFTVPGDHEHYVFGFGEAGDLVRREADVVLVVGSRLEDLVPALEGARRSGRSAVVYVRTSREANLALPSEAFQRFVEVYQGPLG